jgi:hypothetical protein
MTFGPVAVIPDNRHADGILAASRLAGTARREERGSRRPGLPSPWRAGRKARAASAAVAVAPAATHEPACRPAMNAWLAPRVAAACSAGGMCAATFEAFLVTLMRGLAAEGQPVEA